MNNLVEQDHRFIKRLVKPGMGFFSFESAWRTLQGYEAMNMVRKGQMCGVEKGDIMGQVGVVALAWNSSDTKIAVLEETPDQSALAFHFVPSIALIDIRYVML